MRNRIIFLAGLLSGLLLITSCQNGDTPAGSGTVPESTTDAALVAPQVAASTATSLPPTPAPTNTPEPTPTPTAPLAALVNGQPIFLADYEQELARYEQAQAELGVDVNTVEGYRDQVLDSLIERELIRQAAETAGVVITDEQLDERLADLRAAAGEPANFTAWLEANDYTEETFREALRLELITGEMVNRVTADVPTTSEQVRARYIQLDDGALADEVHGRAVAGDDFAFLAQQNSVDRVTGELGGDLGYFGRGALLVPEVEEAAFALQPGEISDIIAVTNADGTTTYYIVQVTERDPNRELTADGRYQLLQAAFSEWVQEQWTNATIERFAPAAS
ncbi:MAG: SurA N-terminal domain-containing protein [Chloroflexota bacterium]